VGRLKNNSTIIGARIDFATLFGQRMTFSPSLPHPTETFTATMTDGLAIECRRFGIGKGPCLVITHGNGFAIDGYRVFWEPLLDRFDVVVFDMRNHGRNPPSGADGHHYHQFARDIGAVNRAVKARLRADQAIVGVFHSMSARSAMKHAIESGWHWNAMVLFDPPNMPLRTHPLYEIMRTFELKLVDWACNRPERFASPEEMIQEFRESRAARRWLPQAIDDMGRAVIRPSATGGWELTCQRELEAAVYLGALTLELWPPATAFGGPFKMIGCDPTYKGNPPTGAANKALAEEHGYLYEWIPTGGHMLQIERPEECRQSMLSFLAAQGIG
jgi:pimeloyl-ACP methyl ester carboxylesterase